MRPVQSAQLRATCEAQPGGGEPNIPYRQFASIGATFSLPRLAQPADNMPADSLPTRTKSYAGVAQPRPADLLRWLLRRNAAVVWLHYRGPRHFLLPLPFRAECHPARAILFPEGCRGHRGLIWVEPSPIRAGWLALLRRVRAQRAAAK